MATITIPAGVTSTGLIIEAGDILNIQSGGTATSTTENGGAVNITDGGVADFLANTITGATVDNYAMTVHENTQANENTFGWGGFLKVYDGGIASGNIVNGGWAGVDVYSGGVVKDTTANVGSGYFTVYDGGFAENIVFNGNWRWGSGLTVMTNAIVTGATVTGDGRMYVSAGAAANNTLQVAGNIYAEGTLTGFTGTGGALHLNENGVANDVNLTSATMNINNGAVASGLVVKGIATVNIAADGKLDGLTEVGIYNTVNIASDGSAFKIRETGGAVNVTEGGIVEFVENTITGATVDNYAMTVHKNTQANENTFGWGGFLKVYDGGIASGNIVNGGWAGVDVYSGGVVKDTTANVGSGYFTVYDGGFAENIVFNGNWRWGSGLTVMTNAIVTGATVTGDGRMYVSAGAAANNTLQVAGNIYAEGTLTGFTGTGGALHLNENGVANDVNLTNATMNVNTGGAANGIVVGGSATLNVASGGTATAIRENGGAVVVAEGGIVEFDENTITGQTIGNTTMTVHKNTQANENLFTWAGILKVYDGGVASGNVFEASWAGIDISGGRITGTTANVGSGYFNVSAGGIAENTVFSDNWRWGGHMNVYADASVTGTTVNAGYLIVKTGGTATDTLVDGGNLNVDGGGIATGAVLTAGTLNVNAEGAATGVTANADARINVLSGGSLNDATVNLHGNMYVSNGGTATNIKENGGYVEVQDGATATSVSNLITGATMWNGRTMTLHSGTTATDVAMEGSGFIHVYEGGLLENTTLNYSGPAYVSSGGIATGMTLNNGGRIYLSGGALATDTTLQGGDLIVSNGGLVTGKVDIASGGVWLAESATFLIDLTNRAPKSRAGSPARRTSR